MIKKISQLDRLRKNYSLTNISEDDLLLEVAYKTNDDQLNQRTADEKQYYNSYAINKLDLENIIGIPEIREVLSVILSGGISTITGNLDIGTPGEETPDRLSGNGHKYHPDLNHTLTIYSKSEFEGKNNTFHGTTAFHNNVVISCDTNKTNITKPILHVGGVATFDQTINGTAYRAQWGDLAEIYDADDKYEPGTLVQFGGEKEITIATDKVNAVVTSKPGIVLDNEKAKNMTFPTEIALIGKVPIKVIGPVKKFDNIVLSKLQPGVGVTYNFSLPYEVIGKALEDNFNSKEKLVLCATNLNMR